MKQRARQMLVQVRYPIPDSDAMVFVIYRRATGVDLVGYLGVVISNTSRSWDIWFQKVTYLIALKFVYPELFDS